MKKSPIHHIINLSESNSDAIVYTLSQHTNGLLKQNQEFDAHQQKHLGCQKEYLEAPALMTRQYLS